MKNQTTFIRGRKVIGTFALMACLLFNLNASSQNLQSLLSETWTGTEWTNSFLSTITYDTNGYAVNSLVQFWDPDATAWDNVSQSIFTNDTNGNPTQTLMQNAVLGTTSWNDSQRINTTYNASNKPLVAIGELWTGVEWTNLYQETSTYDGAGYRTNSLYESWDPLSTSWVNNNQTNYTNNPTGSIATEVSQMWNSGLSVWTNDDRITYTYNGADKVLTSLTETWDDTESWVNSERSTNTYDGSGYLTTTLRETWDASTDTWINADQIMYTNDFGGTPQMAIVQMWNTGIGVWEDFLRITYTYVPLAVNEFASMQNALYPNPANDVVMIKMNTGNTSYIIADQSGRQVLSGMLNDGETVINVSGLASGVYFVKAGDIVIKMLKE